MYVPSNFKLLLARGFKLHNVPYIIASFIHTCSFMQINEQFSGRPLNESQVFSVEISNATESRFVKSTIIFIQLPYSFPMQTFYFATIFFFNISFFYTAKNMFYNYGHDLKICMYFVQQVRFFSSNPHHTDSHRGR